VKKMNKTKIKKRIEELESENKKDVFYSQGLERNVISRNGAIIELKKLID